MADDPLRLRVLMAMTLAFQEITPGNGYVIDLSGTGKNTKVFRGRAVFGEGDPIPMLSILEPPLPPDRIDAPLMSEAVAGRWELVIQGFAKDDKVNPTDPAHVFSADVLKRLALEKRSESGKPYAFGIKQIKEIIIGPPVVRPPDDLVSSKAYFWVSVSINLAEKLTEPYAD